LLLLEVAFPNRVWLLRFSILALSLLVLLLTQSKTMWTLTALSISLLGFNFIWRQPLPKRVVGLLLFAGIGLMPASLLVLLPDVLDPLQRMVESRSEDLTSLTGRTVIWQTVLSIVEENPWFGYGPHLWDPEMALQYASWVGWTPAQSHNQYIQSLGEGGWIGLGGFILYGLILSINAFRVRRVGLGLPFVLVLAWFIRGFTESWYRKATTDGNLFIHMVIFALVVLAVRELRRGQSG
jgi:O-antigen ligase